MLPEEYPAGEYSPEAFSGTMVRAGGLSLNAAMMLAQADEFWRVIEAGRAGGAYGVPPGTEGP
jgi:hypothetical protein